MSCPQGHALKGVPPGVQWCCDGCSSHNSGSIPSYGCRACDFDLCARCASATVTRAVGAQPHEKLPPRHCKGGHVLQRAPVPCQWRCDACHMLFSKDFPSFGCRACDFDICEHCISGPPCKGQHALLNDPMPCQWRCDMCQKLSPQENPSRGCRVCDYDLCMTCFGKEKKRLAAKLHEEHPPPPQPQPTPVQPSQPSHPTPTPQPAAVVVPTARGKTRALFIGINYTGSEAQLSGCVNDVATMMKLVADMGLDLKDRKVLVDDKKFPARTGEPTKSEIMSHFKWLVERAQAGDTLFLHYSGHGSKMRDQDGDEDDGYDEALVPVDYTRSGLIRDDDIFNIVCKGIPKGCRLTAITDCCHSGSILDLPYTFVWQGEKGRFGNPNAGRKGEQVFSRDFSAENKKRCDGEILMFSGCQDSQTSADVSNVNSFTHSYKGPGSAGGALTNGLAELVAKYHTSGSGPNLNLSYGEMLLALQESLKKRRFTQIPQLSSSHPFEMDDSMSFKGPL